MIRLGQWLAGDGFHDYHHAFVVLGPEGNTGMTKIVEAMPGGARMADVYQYGDEPVYLRCPPEYREDVAMAAISFLGVPYSAADYFALALHRFRIPTPHLRRRIETSKKMICSQLADAAAARGGWHLFDDGRWPGYVTPGDLYKVYRAQKPGEYVERWKGSR